jgi:hypothetical protein
MCRVSYCFFSFLGGFFPRQILLFFYDKKFEKIEENFALILLNVSQVFFISQIWKKKIEENKTLVLAEVKCFF